jgi:DNA-binding NarL/FixJ family response regulator
MDPSDKKSIDILIVDDHPVYRWGLKTLLEGMGDLRVVGEAESAAEAIAKTHDLRPQLVVMDISMPGETGTEATGTEATKTLSAKYPKIGVIIVTMHADKETFLSAIRAGARGFLLKEASWEEVSLAIRVVSAGGLAFDAHSASWIVDHLTNPQADANPFPELTEREREVLELIADGLGNSAIARQMGLSVKTVRNYISRIFAKLQVIDRTEAAVRARRAGLGH